MDLAFRTDLHGFAHEVEVHSGTTSSLAQGTSSMLSHGRAGRGQETGSRPATGMRVS